MIRWTPVRVGLAEATPGEKVLIEIVSRALQEAVTQGDGTELH